MNTDYEIATNNFDGGTNLTTITTANSTFSGNAFDFVTGTPTYASIPKLWDDSGFVGLFSPGQAVGWTYGSPNLLGNSDFEYTIDGWYGYTNSTVARTVQQAYIGNYSLEATATSTSMQVANNPRQAVIPGTAYTFSAHVRAKTTGRSCRARIWWYTTAGAFISSNDGTLGADTTSGWNRLTVTATAPATAASAFLVILFSPTAVGEVHYVDALMFEAGSTASTYVDGSGHISTAYTRFYASRASNNNADLCRLTYFSPSSGLNHTFTIRWASNRLELVISDGTNAYYLWQQFGTITGQQYYAADLMVSPTTGKARMYVYEAAGWSIDDTQDMNIEPYLPADAYVLKVEYGNIWPGDTGNTRIDEIMFGGSGYFGAVGPGARAYDAGLLSVHVVSGADLDISAIADVSYADAESTEIELPASTVTLNESFDVNERRILSINPSSGSVGWKNHLSWSTPEQLAFPGSFIEVRYDDNPQGSTPLLFFRGVVRDYTTTVESTSTGGFDHTTSVTLGSIESVWLDQTVTIPSRPVEGALDRLTAYMDVSAIFPIVPEEVYNRELPAIGEPETVTKLELVRRYSEQTGLPTQALMFGEDIAAYQSVRTWDGLINFAHRPVRPNVGLTDGDQFETQISWSPAVNDITGLFPKSAVVVSNHVVLALGADLPGGSNPVSIIRPGAVVSAGNRAAVVSAVSTNFRTNGMTTSMELVEPIDYTREPLVILET